MRFLIILGSILSLPALGVEPANPKVDSTENKVVSKYSSQVTYYQNNKVPVSRAIFESHADSLEFAIPMVYNERVEDMVQFFGTTWQDRLKKMLTLSEFYFPIYEEILDKNGLPLEFKYLSVIESALNPKATSYAGAKGLWQFMKYTGKIYDLEVGTYLDERSHITKSTQAACEYFKDMYKMFGDWHMVIASYNCGPGNVRKAIRRSGGKTTFWEIAPYLPRQTQKYVPSFIAAAYLMEYAASYQITPAPVNDLPEAFTVIDFDRNISLQALYDKTGLTEAQLLTYNPELKRGILPPNVQSYALKMPVVYAYSFLEQKDVIIAYSEELVPEEVFTHYVVQRGDSLGLIAKKHGCSVTEIKSWNNLRSNLIHPGQKLDLFL